jgi:hypothetical protein
MHTGLYFVLYMDIHIRFVNLCYFSCSFLKKRTFVLYKLPVAFVYKICVQIKLDMNYQILSVWFILAQEVLLLSCVTYFPLL